MKKSGVAKTFSRAGADDNRPLLQKVFAEGESGIPKGCSPLAAGGEIT